MVLFGDVSVTDKRQRKNNFFAYCGQLVICFGLFRLQLGLALDEMIEMYLTFKTQP